MKEPRAKKRFSLTLMLSAVVFAAILLTFAILGVGLFVCQRLGLIDPSLAGRGSMPFFLAVAGASLIIGTLLSMLIARIPLKPVNGIINAMNRLASGDFKTRLSFPDHGSRLAIGRELSESFNKMASELENTELLRSDFVNNFSHEFKTPIVSIRGFAKLLRRGGLDPETTDEYLAIIESESARLSDMATNMLNLTRVETGAVLNVSRGKGGDALKCFRWRLRTQKPHIECVCMDMSNAYGKWVRENLPGVPVIYDHFHVIKAMNDHINGIRRKAMARISADVRRCIRELDVEKMAKEEVLAAIKAQEKREEEAKKSLKGNMRLPLMDKEDVEKDPKSKKKLDRMLDENKDLGKAYVMKERLRDIYLYCQSKGSAKAMLFDWIEEAKASDVAELEKMAKTIEEHLEGVLGFWEFRGASNAKTEGFNNKIRWLIKQAYGYRDFKYFRLKIFDLPNLKPRDSDC